MIGACSVALRVYEDEVRLCRAGCAAGFGRAPSGNPCSSVAFGAAICANPGALDARSGSATPGVGWRSAGSRALPASATRRTRDPRSLGLRPTLWRRAWPAGVSPSRGALPARAVLGTLTDSPHFWSTVLSSPVDPERSATTALPLSARHCRLRRRMRPRMPPTQQSNIGLRQTAATTNHPIKPTRPLTLSALPAPSPASSKVMLPRRRSAGGEHAVAKIARKRIRPRRAEVRPRV